MTLHRFCRRQLLAIGIKEAWAYFSNPSNLAVITPPWLDFIVTSELPAAMYEGMIVSYRLRPFGRLQVTWVTEITHVDAPRFFVDEQRLGPYRLWHHEHHFTAVDGGVMMDDIVHYALGFGPPGDLAQRLLVAPRLAAIFDYRRRVLAGRFGELPGTQPAGRQP